MWLTFDRFGRNLLFGKIPGSQVDKKNTQVNMVSIQNVMCNNLTSVNYQKAALPILDSGDLVDESNAFDVAKELNSFDTLDLDSLSTFDNLPYILNKFDALDLVSPSIYNNGNIGNIGNMNVGYPRVNNKPPLQEKLDYEYGQILANLNNTYVQDKNFELVKKVPVNIINELEFKIFNDNVQIFGNNSNTLQHNGNNVMSKSTENLNNVPLNVQIDIKKFQPETEFDQDLQVPTRTAMKDPCRTKHSCRTKYSLNNVSEACLWGNSPQLSRSTFAGLYKIVFSLGFMFLILQQHAMVPVKNQKVRNFACFDSYRFRSYSKSQNANLVSIIFNMGQSVITNIIDILQSTFYKFQSICQLVMEWTKSEN